MDFFKSLWNDFFENNNEEEKEEIELEDLEMKKENEIIFEKELDMKAGKSRRKKLKKERRKTNRRRNKL